MMVSRMRRRASTLLCTLLLLSLSLLCCFQPASAHGGIDDEGDAATPAVHHPDHLRSKDLIAVKVWCLVILLVSTFAAGVSPYLYRWNEAFLLLGTQFAGGVFLGTALMHFLADSTTTFHGLLPRNLQYPFSYMLACAGFLLTMLADCVVAAVTTRRNKKKVVVNGDGAEEEEGDSAHAQHHRHPMFVLTSSSLEDAVLLIFALCFHSIFEGIAIGVSATKSDAWRNLWTIGLHKVLAAVAMGIALLRMSMIPSSSNKRRRPFLATASYSLAFAVSSPVGVGIGIGIDATAEGRAADWTFAVSMGFAAGVFLYVAINHLIIASNSKGLGLGLYRRPQPQEQEEDQEGTKVDGASFKLVAVLLGVTVMAVVMIWD